LAFGHFIIGLDYGGRTKVSVCMYCCFF
jgi:hypothetical protein